MLKWNPPDPSTIKTTPRKLIEHWFGNRPVGQAALQEAVALMRRAGWLNNYIPGSLEVERTMVFVPARHRYEPIFRCLDASGNATVPRGLIESRTRCLVASEGAGVALGSYGLAIVGIDGCNIVIRGTSGGMAWTVNAARYGDERPHRASVLVENATGFTFPAERLKDDLRLRTALAFEEFDVDVPDLLDGQATSVASSRWRFPATLPPPSLWPPKSKNCPPTYPPDSTDPDAPPF